MRALKAEAGWLSHRQAALCLLVIVTAIVGSPHDAFAARSRTPNISEALALVIRGDQLSELEGVEAARLSAFACKGGLPSSLMFQFDERDAAGLFVGNAATGRQRDDTPGVIDANDEFAFMLTDVGESCPPAILARSAGTVYEIRADRPSLQEPGYLYLLLGERGMLPSRPLIRYDAASDTMTSDILAVGFDPKNPIIVNHLALAEYRPRPRVNLLDRLKIRFTGRALRDLISLSIDESEVDAEILAARSGTLRAIREIAIAVQPVPGFSIKGHVTFVLYRRHAEIFVTVDVPKAGALFVSSLDLEIGLDFIDLRGTRVSTNSLPEGVLVDGAMIAQENNLSLGDEPWVFIGGNGINMLGYIDPDPKMGVTAAANFLDSRDALEPPESVPGTLPKIGYFFKNWQNVKAGSYRLFAYYGILPGFPEGGGSGFYKVTHESTSVQVRLVGAKEPASDVRVQR